MNRRFVSLMAGIGCIAVSFFLTTGEFGPTVAAGVVQPDSGGSRPSPEPSDLVLEQLTRGCASALDLRLECQSVKATDKTQFVLSGVRILRHTNTKPLQWVTVARVPVLTIRTVSPPSTTRPLMLESIIATDTTVYADQDAMKKFAFSWIPDCTIHGVTVATSVDRHLADFTGLLQRIAIPPLVSELRDISIVNMTIIPPAQMDATLSPIIWDVRILRYSNENITIDAVSHAQTRPTTSP